MIIINIIRDAKMLYAQKNHKIGETDNNFISQMFQRCKLETRSMYRSVRYRVNRDEYTRTADPSTCNFRIKRNSLHQGTMAQTIDTNINSKINNEQLQELMKTQYLQSFNSMMATASRVKLKNKSQKQMGVSFFDDARIILPAFQQNEKQVQYSQHSLLTPFMKPYSHVKMIYKSCQNELKSQKVTCAQIRHGLEHVKSLNHKNLQNIQSEFKNHFESLQGILRKNQISQQEKKLKTKRELEELNQQHQKNRKLFENVDSRSSQLQISIFNSTPYNLRERHDELGKVYI